MSTQTTDSDSPSAAGFQLGYLHKQADDRYVDAYTSDNPSVQEALAYDQPAQTIKPQRFGNPDFVSSLDANRLRLGIGLPAEYPSGDSGAEELDWEENRELSLAPDIKKVDQAADESLQMAKYEPVKTEGSLTDPSPNNKEKVLSILSELAPGAAIGGTAGVGLSLAQDAKKGGGVRLGKAVGMGAGGAAAGALIQALAKRQKLRATALA